MHTVLHGKTEMPAASQAPTSPARDKVLEALQRKANILSALYEMSKTLGSVFDLETIFAKATDIIFRSTPADRVVALLAEGTGKENPEDVMLNPIAMRARDESLEQSRAQADDRPHHHPQSDERSRGAAVTGRGL